MTVWAFFVFHFLYYPWLFQIPCNKRITDRLCILYRVNKKPSVSLRRSHPLDLCWATSGFVFHRADTQTVSNSVKNDCYREISRSVHSKALFFEVALKMPDILWKTNLTPTETGAELFLLFLYSTLTFVYENCAGFQSIG